MIEQRTIFVLSLKFKLALKIGVLLLMLGPKIVALKPSAFEI